MLDITQHHPYALNQGMEQEIRKVYFYHDIRITCYTNHPVLIDALDAMLSIFPQPSRVRGEASYYLLCYENASQFPMQLPDNRTRIDAVQLLTGTRLKYYTNPEGTIIYQKYMPLPSINEMVLSVIDGKQHMALTQLEPLTRYDTAFLRRYVLLLTLGELMRYYGFEPCHAAAISAPWDEQQGALILGTSGSGKTTLSLGCASIGCGLVGDDLVSLHENQQSIGAYTIQPEVSVRSASLELWEPLKFLKAYPADQRDKRYCPIERICPGATCLQTPIRVLIFPSLVDRGKSELIPLSQAATLQLLIQLCISKEGMFPRVQERLFVLLAKLAEQARGYQLVVARGDRSGPQRVCSLLAGAAL